MAGNHKNNLKTRNKHITTNPNFYREIGALGGKAKTDKLKGFAANRELASRVGKIGGTNSKRPK
jgi:general stress protein YciG